VSGTEPSRAGTLEDVLAAPAETRRLLTGWARWITPPDRPWEPALVEGMTHGLSTGRQRGRLWVGPGGDEAVGVAVGALPKDVGGRLDLLYLDEGFRGGASVRAFLASLEAPSEFGPVVEIPDPPVGPDGDVARATFRSLGFVPIERVDMRYPPERAVFEAPAVEGVRVRTVVAKDLEALAQLEVRTYADNPVDVALFRGRWDRAGDAREHIAMLFGEEIGEFLPAGSFLAEDDRGVVGATLANDREGVLITQVMVDPRARRRGLAAQLLASTLKGLRVAGRTDVRLVVTCSNRRAERRYRSLGFVRDEANRGSHWVHPERLGLSAADLAGT
jgi:ribosomal protein S18 acetylase RimI-like enzyme